MTDETLIKAMPKDATIDPTGERLAELVSSIAGRKMPVSSFSRMWNLGSAHARVTLGYFAYWLRSRFADDDGKQRLKNEAHLAAALQLFSTMGYLRGAVMKVGQMLANLPEIVPEEFAEVLSALHFEAPPMHYAMVRDVFLDEFGREPEELFASFDRQAFAAASLGQVHRARLHSGEEVAVKVQYPHIARTIKADLRNLRILLQPMCLTSDWQNTLDKLTDLEHVLLMETDYENEARISNETRQLYGDEDQVVVPRVHEQYSTKRVLTTDYLAGKHLEQLLAENPSQEERDHFCTLISKAIYRIYYRLHRVHADPHPGNFIFMEDGRLGLIDFGCSRVITDDEWRLMMAIEQAGIDGDEEALSRLIAEACLCKNPGEIEPDRLETVRRGVDWQLKPTLTEGLYDMGDREEFLRGVTSLMEMTRKGYTRGSPLYLWTNRLCLGARAVGYRLKGRVHHQKIQRQEFAAVKGDAPC
ncbi:protein kinase, ABC1 domain-containing, putative [Geotalea daltonii FRC-32]|uniref:Protein kinase, ABC1 domain-containing, putative n=1 Tax=Geotalea daltonii (strain DSM 22248 / JCM 15807 / FRC-32) TaxID=316067 RepID=B9M8B0_GEODF|nr:AarF/ABC1/UbiB kinase family protein [Geotalea daltonii]ACM20376.1 protein kinase, ABC1 domain-containing, putative [Geotalea daltonii FRC-32]